MFRRMGFQYDRLELSSVESDAKGATVSPVNAGNAAAALVTKMVRAPACVLKEAWEDPYFDAANRLFDV
jgi:hypothetical protein